MQVGTLVKYSAKYANMINVLWDYPSESMIGIVIATKGQVVRVQWNIEMTLWDPISVLEVLCK